MWKICSLLIQKRLFIFYFYKVSTNAICGNGIKETGEQCDCGFPEDCNEICCNAAGTAQQCQYKPNVICSPSEGSCCASNCSYLPSTTICQTSSGCLKDITCSGNAAVCPNTNQIFFKPDNETCNSGTQVCKAGVCGGTICDLYGLTQCFLQSADNTAKCHLACNGSN